MKTILFALAATIFSAAPSVAQDYYSTSSIRSAPYEYPERYRDSSIRSAPYDYPEYYHDQDYYGPGYGYHGGYWSNGVYYPYAQPRTGEAVERRQERRDRPANETPRRPRNTNAR